MKINNLLQNVSEIAFEQFNALTESKNTNQTSPQDPLSVDNAAIEHLSKRVAEQNQIFQVQNTDIDLSESVSIDFKTDFGDKALKDITQADAMQVFYRKLGQRAGLVEPRLGEFVTERISAGKSNQIYHLDKNNKPFKPYEPKEFNALKKAGTTGISPSQNTLAQLKQVKSNQTADVLLEKYQTLLGLDEKGLSKELASLANNDLGAVQAVFSRLKQGESGFNAGQSVRVANQMVGNMSNDEISLLAQKRKGDKFLKELNENFKNESPILIDGSITFGSQARIEEARTNAKAVLLGDKTASLSDWEKLGIGDNETLNRLQVLKVDETKGRELFDRLYPNMKGKTIVTGSEEAEELSYLEKLAAQNRYNQIIDRTVAEAKPNFPQLDEKTLKAMLIQESGLDPNAANSSGFAGVAQIGTRDVRQGGITLAERFVPEKAIPAAVRILKAKAEYLEGQVSTRAFIKYGRPQGDDYIKFILAAYNRGEGTIANAMDNAYEKGKQVAQGKGLTGDDAEQFAKDYATKWDNLIDEKNPTESPLRKATSATGYNEATTYVRNIVEVSRRPK